jgi:hypothetical protein
MTQRVTLTSVQQLDEIVSVRGVPCRTWQGYGPNGEEVLLFVAMVLVPTPEAQKLFQPAPIDLTKLH